MTDEQRPSDPARRAPRPSATRSASNRRVGRVGMFQRGNAAAWSHGIFATVASRPDVTVESALILEAHPGLDPLRDRRLVESLALANVQLRRAFLAMEADGLTPTLTAHHAKVSALAERLESQCREVAAGREATGRRGVADLSRYRSGGGPA